jgi:hypothetical protein
MNYRLPREIYEALEDAFLSVEDIAGTRVYLTPRAVARRVPKLSTRELGRRRSEGLAPAYDVVAGCIMYAEDEIAHLSIDAANDNAIDGGEEQ